VNYIYTNMFIAKVDRHVDNGPDFCIGVDMQSQDES